MSSRKAQHYAYLLELGIRRKLKQETKRRSRMSYNVRTGEGCMESSKDLSIALNQWMQTHGPVGLFKTCATCRHMERTGPAKCHKYGVTPPVDVIMRGCPAYDDESDIPF